MNLLTLFVIQSEAKNLGNIHVDVLGYVTEILPPYGRLNDTLVNRYAFPKTERLPFEEPSLYLSTKYQIKYWSEIDWLFITRMMASANISAIVSCFTLAQALL